MVLFFHFFAFLFSSVLFVVTLLFRPYMYIYIYSHTFRAKRHFILKYNFLPNMRECVLYMSVYFIFFGHFDARYVFSLPLCFFHPRSLCVERSPVTTHWLYMSIWSNLQNNNGCMCVFHSRHFLLSTFFPVSLFLFWSRWIVCCVCCIPLIILLYLPTHILYWMAFFPFSLLLHFAFCFPCNQAILTSYMSEQKKKKVDMREKRQIVMLPKQVCVSVSPCMLWTISKRYFIYTNIW